MKKLFCALGAIIIVAACSAQMTTSRPKTPGTGQTQNSKKGNNFTLVQKSKQIPGAKQQKTVTKQGSDTSKIKPQTNGQTKKQPPGTKPGNLSQGQNSRQATIPKNVNPNPYNKQPNNVVTGKNTRQGPVQNSQGPGIKQPNSLAQNQNNTNAVKSNNPGNILNQTDSSIGEKNFASFVDSRSSLVSDIASGKDTATVEELRSCTDITDAILTNSSPFAKDYVGKYCATVKDVLGTGGTLTSRLTIIHAGNKTLFITNAIPNHDFNDLANFPNTVSEQNYTFKITDNPTGFPLGRKTPLSLDYYNAVLLNGAVVDLLSDGCCCPEVNPPADCGEMVGCSNINNPWRKDPMSPKGKFQPDSHNAHCQEDGTYHYHGPPNALYDITGKTESPVIGFAADGYPIYGPYINDNGTIREVKSSYQLKTDSRPTNSCPGSKEDTDRTGGLYIQDYEYIKGSGDLDECNGMMRNGHYGYYVTFTYPYMIKYFRGTPDPSFKKPKPTPKKK